jgi:hypothetical protein
VHQARQYKSNVELFESSQARRQMNFSLILRVPLNPIQKRQIIPIIPNAFVARASHIENFKTSPSALSVQSTSSHASQK